MNSGVSMVTWGQLLALDPCDEGLAAARMAFPDWPDVPPTWSALLGCGEENQDHLGWFLERMVPLQVLAAAAELFAASVSHLTYLWAATDVAIAAAYAHTAPSLESRVVWAVRAILWSYSLLKSEEPLSPSLLGRLAAMLDSTPNL